MTDKAIPVSDSASIDDASVGAPEKAGIILATLIIVAAVANLPLAMANVALPSIGQAFGASQTQLNLVLVAPRSARLVESRGARSTLLIGYVFVLLGFVTMLLLWKEGISYWIVGLGYAFVGIGVGFAGTPASHSLTGAVPVTRAGMASGTADLQRDLGGAIMQSIFGALLATGYAAAVTAAIAAAPAADQSTITPTISSELTMSYAGAQSVAAAYPQYATEITTAAKESFLAGDQNAYIAGIIAALIGAALVFFMFPKKDEERRLLGEYHAQDMAAFSAENTQTTEGEK